MSTKINHGRIKRRATLEQALAELVRIRPAFIQEARKAVATVIARKLAFGRDLAENYCLVDEDRNRWSRNHVLGQIEDAYRNQDNTIKTMNWDFIGSVSVLPFRGDVLMLTYWRNHAPFARLIEDAGFTTTTRTQPTGLTQSAKLSGTPGEMRGMRHYPPAGQSMSLSSSSWWIGTTSFPQDMTPI
ncbi:hypothetical protein [Pseudomonas aeruginosa]|uniref:hypothetical protein n=1 Tax=Pseudomonas aeruginosa TaxID=287 RepID=UPI0021199C76|nr:hypothetical protein [Pseudomonas aeruginosa]